MRIFKPQLKKTIMTKQEKNKALVLEAFETAFNNRDQSAYERFWSPNYIQHSAHIEPGREGLQKIMSSTPANMKYEHALILAEGDFVMVHGRYSNTGLPRPWVIVDILRIENGLLAEHWDVIQDEVTAEESKSGRPMFGEGFFRT
jgi:predicted SnoaL-like aldol condensation-catalyzing enzyme